VSAIPIQNLYYLLCYSWNRLAEAEVVDVNGIDSTEQVDLFASVLIKGTKHLLRRGLERGYQDHSEVIPGIRGRLNIAVSAQKMLFSQGLAHCEFDELTTNTLANQIIKSAIWHLSRVPQVNRDLRRQLVGLHRELSGIDTPALRKSLFRKVQLHANARYYKFLLNVCELVSDSLLVDESNGQYKFRDFMRDERAMARVFEEFLFNFYKTERRDLSFKKERILWAASSDTPNNMAYLPTMETDISVRSKARTLIIDAKYYKKTLTTYYDTERVYSANLYQLFAYLKNIEVIEPPEILVEGMLLYPVVNNDVRLDYNIHGNRVRICTVNLARHWSEIKCELLEILDDSDR
jgi:5-methylcytosine-specific restriction enzyme subunit McrC